MTALPTVSVLIPAYNAAEYISDAVRSALRQTYRDLEIVVIDDGSTDDTARMTEAFGQPVRTIRAPHAGVAAARNRGLREVRGRYILFLDADDMIGETLVARAVDFLERRPDLAFVFVNARLLIAGGRLSRPRIPPECFGGAREAIVENPLRQVLDAGYIISSSGLCAPREAVDRAGLFDERLWGAEDFEYWSRFYLAQPIGYIADPLATLRRHDRNMSSVMEDLLPGTVRATASVARRCEALGRPDLARTARRYGRRRIYTGLRSLLILGRAGEARSLLWDNRRLLRGPGWPLWLAASLVPGSSVRALVHLVKGARGLIRRVRGSLER